MRTRKKRRINNRVRYTGIDLANEKVRSREKCFAFSPNIPWFSIHIHSRLFFCHTLRYVYNIQGFGFTENICCFFLLSCCYCFCSRRCCCCSYCCCLWWYFDAIAVYVLSFALKSSFIHCFIVYRFRFSLLSLSFLFSTLITIAKFSLLLLPLCNIGLKRNIWKWIYA